MASFTLAQPNPQTQWLPGRVLSLMPLVFLIVLTCGGILALTIISTRSIEPAPADETASPTQNWTVQATTVIEPTRIIGSVYASPIPKPDVPDDLVFLDQENSNFDLTTGQPRYVQPYTRPVSTGHFKIGTDNRTFRISLPVTAFL